MTIKKCVTDRPRSRRHSFLKKSSKNKAFILKSPSIPASFISTCHKQYPSKYTGKYVQANLVSKRHFEDRFTLKMHYYRYKSHINKLILDILILDVEAG